MNSDYEVRLATLEAMGGDTTKHYDSVYEIDLEILKIFTEELTKYARKHKCIFIKIDPDIKRHDLDSEGNILGNDNNKLIEFLKNNGYKHKGFNIEFTNEQPRFTFRLDLTQSEEEILSNIHSTSRKT